MEEACTSFTYNINSLPCKTDEIRYITKLTNATVIGISEIKLGNAVLSSELEIEGYDLVKFDRRWGEGRVACFLKNPFLYNRKLNFCINTDSIFYKYFSIKIQISYNWYFINRRGHTFSDTNVIESEECYLLGDININFQPMNKEISRNKSAINCARKISLPKSHKDTEIVVCLMTRQSA